MGLPRFLYSNLITAESMISVSSLKNGIVTSALKDGTGSAVITTGGAFTGATDLEYTVDIDSIAGGAEVGQATFRWSDGGGSWDADGVTTSATPITLNNGVTIYHTTGAGADFVVGDTWYFKGINLFNAGKTIDWDRDSRYRSAALESPNTITIDLGSAQEIKALAIWDHNFTSGVTLAVKGHTADAWGSPDFSEAVSYNADTILHYLSSATTKRYWRLEVTDAANSDGYIEIGEIFLGSYIEPAKGFEIGDTRDRSMILNTRKSMYGIRKHRFYNLPHVFNCEFLNISASDMNNFETMAEALGTRSTGVMTPFFFNPDSAAPNDAWLVELTRLPREAAIRSRFNTVLEMEGVVKSV